MTKLAGPKEMAAQKAVVRISVGFMTAPPMSPGPGPSCLAQASLTRRTTTAKIDTPSAVPSVLRGSRSKMFELLGVDVCGGQYA
jgi:hypothetical protein